MGNNHPKELIRRRDLNRTQLDERQKFAHRDYFLQVLDGIDPATRKETNSFFVKFIISTTARVYFAKDVANKGIPDVEYEVNIKETGNVEAIRSHNKFHNGEWVCSVTFNYEFRGKYFEPTIWFHQVDGKWELLPNN